MNKYNAFSVDGWIDVNDKLPPAGKDVRIRPNPNYGHVKARYEPHMGRWSQVIREAPNYFSMHPTVTHWKI